MKRKIVIIVDEDDVPRTEDLCSRLDQVASEQTSVVESYVDDDFDGNYQTQEEYDNED